MILFANPVSGWTYRFVIKVAHVTGWIALALLCACSLSLVSLLTIIASIDGK